MYLAACVWEHAGSSCRAMSRSGRPAPRYDECSLSCWKKLTYGLVRWVLAASLFSGLFNDSLQRSQPVQRIYSVCRACLLSLARLDRHIGVTHKSERLLCRSPKDELLRVLLASLKEQAIAAPNGFQQDSVDRPATVKAERPAALLNGNEQAALANGHACLTNGHSGLENGHSGLPNGHANGSVPRDLPIQVKRL